MASFDKRVKQIAGAEKDVDRVLRAAKLQRHPMSNERLDAILTFITLNVLIVAILIFGIALFVFAR